MQFLDRRGELADRGADVGQLDDVGLGLEGQLAQFRQVVGDALLGREEIRKFPEDAGRHRNVALLDFDARRLGEGAQDGQQGVGREAGRFVGKGVDDLGFRGGHGRLPLN